MDVDIDSSALGVTLSILGRERVRCCLSRRDMDATAESRPDGFRWWFEFHRFCIGDAVAEFGGFPRPNACGIGIETKNLEAVSAHLLEGIPGLGAPLGCSPFFQGLICLPAR